MVGLISWLAAAGFVLALAYLTHRPLRLAHPAIDALTLGLLAVVWATAWLLVLGLAGLLDPASILGASLAGLVAVAIIRPARSALADLGPDARQFFRALATWWRSLPGWLRWVTCLGGLAAALRFAFLIWALPPFVWDSLAYHLTNVGHWVQTGKIEVFETPVERIYNPANFEVLATWFTVFLHHDAVVEAAGLPAYGLAVLAVYSAARSLELSRAGSWLAALAFGTTPAVVLATTATKNDIHIAAYYLTVLALVIELERPKQPHASRRSLIGVTLLGVALLLALGTKTYILHLLPGLALVALISVRGRTAPLRWRESARTVVGAFKELDRWRKGVLVATLLTAVFLGSFWNVRNWALTGNPFYPYDVVIGGRTLLAGPESEFRLSVRELALNLQSAAAKFGDWQDPVRPDLPNTTGWGWFVYVIGLPSLAWAMLRRRSIRVLAIGFLLSFLGLMLSNGPSPWNMRFAIWVPALFSLSFAEFHRAMAGLQSVSLHRGIVGLAMVCVALNFVATLTYNRFSAEDYLSMLRLPVSKRHAALLGNDMPQAYREPIGIVPSGALLGYTVHGNGFIYPLYRADLTQRIVYIPIAPSDSCETIARTMEARGTRYLVAAPVHADDRVIAHLEQCSAGETLIRERGRNLYVVKR